MRHVVSVFGRSSKAFISLIKFFQSGTMLRHPAWEDLMTTHPATLTTNLKSDFNRTHSRLGGSHWVAMLCKIFRSVFRLL